MSATLEVTVVSYSRRSWNRFVTMLVVVLMALVGVVVAGTSHAVAAAPRLTVWVAPNGRASNDGLSKQRPVPSLEHAEAVVAKAISRSGARDVTVRIKPGSYRQQTTVWNTGSPGRWISFVPWDYQKPGNMKDSQKPVFDGCGKTKNAVWLAIRNPSGKQTINNTKFEVRNIKVRNYFGGLAVEAGFQRNNNTTGRDVPAKRIGNPIPKVVVTDSTFERIGDPYTNDQSKSGSYYALSLINTRNAYVARNTFVNIINSHSGGKYRMNMHAMYTQANIDMVIENNYMKNVSGDPIRTLHDTSARVTGNRSVNSGYFGLVSDWYVDRAGARITNPKQYYQAGPRSLVVRNNREGDKYGNYKGNVAPLTLFRASDTNGSKPGGWNGSLRYYNHMTRSAS